MLTSKPAFFIRKSTFHGNAAPAGGALYSYDSYMHVTQDSRFHNNVATDEVHGFGGSFYLRANSKLVMNDSSCTNNSANVNGACVYADKSSVSLHNSLCSRNRASNKGGAICAVGNSYSNGIVHSVNSTFTYNSASSGTGIYVDYTSLHVYWSIFRANMQFDLNTNIKVGVQYALNEQGVVICGTLHIRKSTFLTRCLKKIQQRTGVL